MQMTAVPEYSHLLNSKYKRGVVTESFDKITVLTVFTMPLPALTHPVPKPEVIKTICVFCGASQPSDPIYAEEANGLYIH